MDGLIAKHVKIVSVNIFRPEPSLVENIYEHPVVYGLRVNYVVDYIVTKYDFDREHTL